MDWTGDDGDDEDTDTHSGPSFTFSLLQPASADDVLTPAGAAACLPDEGKQAYESARPCIDAFRKKRNRYDHEYPSPSYAYSKSLKARGS